MAEASTSENISANKENNSSTNTEKQKRKYFKWSPKMIQDLIESLMAYKSTMLFKNLDFDADKSAQYAAVRYSKGIIIFLFCFLKNNILAAF